MNSLPPVVGLYSPAARSGKTEIAKYLATHHDYTILKFSGTLKAMALMFVHGAGVPWDEAFRYVDGDLKDELIPGLPVPMTGRDLQISLGTGWGRDSVHPDLWVDMHANAVRRLLAGRHLVVVDDIRKPNELRAMRELNALLITTYRPGAQVRDGDGELDGFVFHRRIVNDGSLRDLHEKVEQAIS